AAADHAIPVHRRDDPHDRCGEKLRHHLRDHARRARLGLGDDQHLSLQRRVRLLRHRLWLGDRARVLRHHCDARRRDALHAQAHRSAIVILIARITPGLSYLIPLFLLFQWLGLLGTLVPQIIIHLVVTVPIVIWIMIGYFETTPLELEEAAVIDGATRWQVFRHVALPIAKPGLAVAFILAVIFSWNNFVFGIVLAGRETRTLPVAVYNMISFDQLSWGPLAAAALIVTFP